MLKVDLDQVAGIAVLEPEEELTKNDFIAAAQTIDPYIEARGELRGLIIHVRSFPGWNSFGSFVTHMAFVRDHHKKISRIAFATDSAIGDVAERAGSHFIRAEIKTFDFNQLDAARQWVLMT